MREVCFLPSKSMWIISVPYIVLTCWSPECMMVLAAFWTSYKKRFCGGGMLMDLVGAPSSGSSLWSLKSQLRDDEWPRLRAVWLICAQSAC